MARCADSSVDEIAAARRNEIEPAAQQDSCRRMNEIAQLVLGSEKHGGRSARGIRESRRDDRT